MSRACRETLNNFAIMVWRERFASIMSVYLRPAMPPQIELPSQRLDESFPKKQLISSYHELTFHFDFALTSHVGHRGRILGGNLVGKLDPVSASGLKTS